MEVCSRPLCRRYYAPLLSIACLVRYGLLAGALAGTLLLVLVAGGGPPPARPVFASLAAARFAAADAAVLLEGTLPPQPGAATVVAAWAWASDGGSPMLQGPGTGHASASSWSVTPVFIGGGDRGGNGSNDRSVRGRGPAPDALRFEADLTPMDASSGNSSAAAAGAAVLSAKVVVRLSLALRVGDDGDGGGGAPWSLPRTTATTTPTTAAVVAFASASSPLPGRGLWAEGELRLEQPGGELAFSPPGRRRAGAGGGGTRATTRGEERRLTWYQRRAAEFWRVLSGDFSEEGEEAAAAAGASEEEEEEEQEEQQRWQQQELLGPLFPEVGAASVAVAGRAATAAAPPSSSSPALELLVATADPALPAALVAANSNSGLRASFGPPLVSWIAVSPGELWRPQRAPPASSPSSSSFRVALTVRLPKRPLLIARTSRADALLWAWARLWAAWAVLGGAAGWLGAWAVRRAGLGAAAASDVAPPAWRF